MMHVKGLSPLVQYGGQSNVALANLHGFTDLAVAGTDSMLGKFSASPGLGCPATALAHARQLVFERISVQTGPSRCSTSGCVTAFLFSIATHKTACHLSKADQQFLMMTGP